MVHELHQCFFNVFFYNRTYICGVYVNNNNEYLECLTCTGPKHLHILCKYILSKFNAYNKNAHTHTHTHTHTHRLAHACMRARTHARTHTHTHTHTHTSRIAGQSGQWDWREKVFKKRKVFKEDLKELAEVEWRTETGSWFQITEAW